MLINCVAYQEGKKLSDITVEAISDYIVMPDCFVWVALREPEREELAEMKEEFGLHELAVEDAQRGNQRPKIEEYGDSLFVVVRTVELDGMELNEGELDIFVAENYVLSVRNNVNRGFLGVRARAEREPKLLALGSSFVLYALMDAVVDRYFPVVDMLESELEKIEDRIFIKGSQRDNIERLYELKRKVLQLRQAILAAGADVKAQQQLLSASLSTMMVIFRGASRLHGERPSTDYEALSRSVAATAGFDPEPFVRVVRHVRGTAKLDGSGVGTALAGYLTGMEQLVAHLDRFDLP